VGLVTVTANMAVFRNVTPCSLVEFVACIFMFLIYSLGTYIHTHIHVPITYIHTYMYLLNP